MKKINEIYFNILNNKYGIALLAILPFLFVQKKTSNELIFLFIVVLISSIVTGKLYNKKECLKFSLFYAICFLVVELISFCMGLLKTSFASMTLIFYFVTILLSFAVKFILWSIAGGLIFYLTNLIVCKIVKKEKLEKFFNPIKRFLANPIIFFSSIILIFAIRVIFTGQIAVVKNIPTLDKPEIRVLSVLDDEKLLLLLNHNNKLGIYNFKNDVLAENNAILSPAPEGFEPYYMPYSFSKMKNGNIFFRRFFVGKKVRKDKKTIASIYSPEKNAILSEFELPEEISYFNNSVTFIDDENALFVGNGINNNKTYVFNVKDKSLVEKAETVKNRSFSQSILLNNGKVFVWNNSESAELYDIKENKYTEIPINIKLYGSSPKDNLQLLDNGNLFIKTCKLEDKKENGVGYHVGGKMGDGYPIPYFLIFNPDDNSFQEINFNKNRKMKLNRFASTSVTKDGKMLLSGGVYVHNQAAAGNNQKMYFYDTKNGKIRETYFYNFNASYDSQIFVLNNNEAIVFLPPILGSKEIKCSYLRVRF